MRLLWLRQIRVSRLARVVCSLLFLYLASPAWPFDFVDNGNGTITDTATGLQWMRCTMGEQWTGSGCSGSATYYTWAAANALSSTVTFAGASDWRLPTIDELKTLIDSSHRPAIDPTAFPGGLYSARYWSSTVHSAYQDYAWYVMFDVGNDTANAQTVSINVRMVRDPGTGGSQTGSTFDVTAAASGDASALTLSLTLQVNAADVGSQGSIFLGALVPGAAPGGAWFLHDGSGWGPWNDGPLTAHSSGSLPASKTIQLLSNTDVSGLAGTQVFAGYGRSGDEMLARGQVKLGYVIPSSTLSDVAYAQGALFGQDAFFSSVSDATAKTTGALLQAILAVNSVLYTDPTVSHIDTFTARKEAADNALSILEKYVQEAEAVLAADTRSARRTAARALNPEDVLATVAAGPVTGQLKTLMSKYGVGAREAKTILDNAMAGLSSEYNNSANFYDKAARTAQLVKEGSGLALTLVGTAATAGAAGGALTLGEATITLITGTDGVVKVTKAGMELIKGADIQLPDGSTASAVLTTLSDTSELISFADLRKWGDLSQAIPNVVNITLKTNDALQDGELNLGAHTFRLKPLAKPVSSAVTDKLAPPQGTIPSTMTGKYRIEGKAVEVTAQPQPVKDVIAMLPPEDRLAEIANIPPGDGASGNGQLQSMTLVYNYTRQDKPLVPSGYCYGSSSATKGSYYFTSNTSQGGSNWGYITSSGSSFTASCTNANCTTQISCQGTISGTTGSAGLSMTCTQGSTTLNITGTTSSGLSLVSGTGSGQTYDQTQGKYVTCDGLNVSGTVSGSFGVGSAAP